MSDDPDLSVTQNRNVDRQDAMVKIDDAGPSDAGPPGSDPFPLSYDKSQIELITMKTETIGATDFQIRFYRNRAYQCGRGCLQNMATCQGYFTFLVLHATNLENTKAPLWVRIHGGGVGYYDDTGTYHPGSDESSNVEESLVKLMSYGPNASEDDVVARRLNEGFRFLIPSMCDHDFHSGIGTPYPNNPNWNGTDSVDGLLALMSAIDFTVNGNGTLNGQETSEVYVHGTSSGGAGAYSAAYAFAQAGIHLNGALLDAIIIGARTSELIGFGWLPPERRDPSFAWAEVENKVGIMLTEPARHAENQVPLGFAVPIFDSVSAQDPFCGGSGTLLSAASALGLTENCDYVHQPIRDAIDGAPASAHHAWFREDSNVHVITLGQGTAVIDAVDQWLQSIRQDSPKSPW